MDTTGFLTKIGPLRVVLLALAVICYPLVLLADMEPVGIGVIPAYVVPALVVILFFVLLLDALMNRVFMVEQGDEVRSRNRLRMRADLLVAAGLVLSWLSWFREIGAL
ncbi:MAG: hypothetical protein D6720_05275 [Gammaproteobacteria bacterium]|nr:MAG: hypothetical protein D6720_05275 [Gammaproteobacteria bacterium]